MEIEHQLITRLRLHYGEAFETADRRAMSSPARVLGYVFGSSGHRSRWVTVQLLPPTSEGAPRYAGDIPEASLRACVREAVDGIDRLQVRGMAVGLLGTVQISHPATYSRLDRAA